MKRKFTLKTMITAFATFGFLSYANAQDPATATWSLLADSSATASGNVVGSPQVTTSILTSKTYNSSFDGITGWQRKGVNQAFPTPVDFTIYDEYKVKPVTGNSLKITQVSFSALGGGTGNMRLIVYYSKNGFATFDSLSAGSASGGSGAAYNSSTFKATSTDPIVLINTSITGLAGKEVVTFPGLNININPGDSFMIRTYPFLSSASASTRYYPTKQFVITGTTTSSAFPVTFSSTKAFQKNSAVQVEWTSATEVNISKYIIERSQDGRTFTEAATVSAKGNSTVATNYSWSDASPFSGNNFYRVKALDKDGNVKYTSILKVSVGNINMGLAISPNPIRGQELTLQLNNLDKGVYTLNIYSNTGQKVMTKQILHQGGSSSEVLQLTGNLKSGVYNLQLTSNGINLSKTLMVE